MACPHIFHASLMRTVMLGIHKSLVLAMHSEVTGDVWSLHIV